MDLIGKEPLEVFLIENGKYSLINKPLFGKFCSSNGYIIVKNYERENSQDTYWEIYSWVSKDLSNEEYDKLTVLSELLVRTFLLVK